MEKSQLEQQAMYHKAVECYQTTEPEQHEEAFQFLKEAAQKGMPEACKLLGIVYMSGQYDPWPAQNMKEAVFWYQSAANAGDEEAMYWLGQCYQMGVGVEVNEDEAQYWIQQAKEHGFVADEEEEANSEEPAEPEATEEIELTEEWPEAEEEPESVVEPEDEPMQDERPQKVPVKQTNLSEEELLSRYEEEEQRARQANQRYRRSTGLGVAGGFFAGALMVGLLIFWFIQDISNTGGSVLFWTLMGVWCVVAAIVGYVLGIKKASERLEEVTRYRKTAFYHAFGCELGQMNPQQIWCLKIYNALSKNYLPVSYRQPEKKIALREYRGCLYPHWVYRSGQEKAQPEFVVLTEKAIYVIHSQYYTGRIQGDLRDAKWDLFEDGDKDLTAKKILNMVDVNRRNMAILKGDLQNQRPDVPFEQIPFYNVILMNPEVDIKGLRRISADDDTFFVQGTPDKLRGNMGLWESRMTTHTLDMEDLMDAFEQVGNQFIKRSGW